MAPYQCLHFHYIIIFDYINTHVQKKKKDNLQLLLEPRQRIEPELA
mgnify:CR=1 FL=1